MKITVCELPNEPDDLSRAWDDLVAHVGDRGSDFVLLPEMPFYRWLPHFREMDPRQWELAVRAHDEWITRLGELGGATVVSSRPVIEDGKHLNVGFVWEPDTGAANVHAKCYLPDEEGFWEASWYERGALDFPIADTSDGRVGFLICTELWFTQHARQYGKDGAQIIVCPRATPPATAAKWLAGGRTAAVVAGAFCLSSNFSGTTADGAEFAGVGWITEPEEGEILGHTSSVEPFLTVDVDLREADRAKRTYPRYVVD
jgi:N-carbamoylputrescine amidase